MLRKAEAAALAAEFGKQPWRGAKYGYRRRFAGSGFGLVTVFSLSFLKTHYGWTAALIGFGVAIASYIRGLIDA